MENNENNENNQLDSVDEKSQKVKKQSNKKTQFLAIGTAVIVIGVIVFAVIFSQLGGKKVPLASAKTITEGMSYKEVSKELGPEKSKEQITFDGSNAQLYTWPANLGDGKYELNVICVDDKVVRVIQTTVEE